MMKNFIRAMASTLLGTVSVAAKAEHKTTASVSKLERELQQLGEQRFTASDYKVGVVRHVVLFRYKDSVTLAQRSEVTSHFLNMQKSSLRNGQPFIVWIETGNQNSGEGADQDLEQAFIVTFCSQGDRNYYVGQPIISDPQYYDPVHQRFKEFVAPLLAPGGVVVFDYTVEQIAK